MPLRQHAALVLATVFSISCTAGGGPGQRDPFGDPTGADGAATDPVSLDESIKALGGQPGTVTLRGGPCVFTENYTVPENVTLVFDHGAPAATLAPRAGVNVVIRGGVVAAATARIKSGEGRVIFTKQAVLHAGWFGFSSGATGKDNLDALRDASSSTYGILDFPGDTSATRHGQTIKLPAGLFAVDLGDRAGVPLNGNGQAVEGAGFSTVLHVSGDGPLFVMNGTETAATLGQSQTTGVWIRSLAMHHVEGPSTAPRNRAVAIDVRDVSNGSGIEDVQIQFFHTGVLGRWRDNFYIFRSQFTRCSRGIHIPPYYPLHQGDDGVTRNGLIPQIVTIEGNQFNFPVEWAIWSQADFNDVYILRNSFGGAGKVRLLGANSQGYVRWLTGHSVNGQGLFIRNNSTEDIIDGQVAFAIEEGKSNLPDTHGSLLTVNNFEFSGNTMSANQGTTLKVDRAAHLLAHTNMFGQVGVTGKPPRMAWVLGAGVLNAVMLNNHYRDPDQVVFDPTSNILRIMDGTPNAGPGKPANPGPFLDLNGVAAKNASGAVAIADGNSKTFKLAGYVRARVNGAEAWIPFFNSTP